MYGNPPCFRCKMPTLAPGNELAWRVFSVCSSQMLVVGLGAPLGLRFEAINIAMDHVGVHPDERREVFEKVRLVGEAYAEQINDRMEAERPKGKGDKPKLGWTVPPFYNNEEWAKLMTSIGNTLEDDGE